MASIDNVSDDDIGEAVDILLIEPNPGDTRLFTEKFRDAKLMNTIHAVSDGEEALDFLYQRNNYEDVSQPDIILLEPQLPGKSGIEVLSELNNESALNDIPIIALTSSEMGEDIVKSHGLEADEYIQKPVETEEFIEFVQEIEDFWFAIVKTQNDE